MRPSEYEHPVFEDIFKSTGLALHTSVLYDIDTYSAGFGLYHHLMLGILSVSALSQAAAFMMIPFGLPLAACDLEFSEGVLMCIDLCLALGERVQIEYVLGGSCSRCFAFRDGHRRFCV